LGQKGIRFSVNVNPYESYTQEDPKVTLEQVEIDLRSETAYRQAQDLHSYGKTKTIALEEVQPKVGSGTINPQNLLNIEDMTEAVQSDVENVRLGFGGHGELLLTDSQVNLYSPYPLSGPITGVTISNGGTAYTTYGGGAFTTLPYQSGGAGCEGTIDTVTLAPLADTTNEWGTQHLGSATDPIRVYRQGEFYVEREDYTVTAITGAGSGVEGEVEVIQHHHQGGGIVGGTITDRGSDYAIGDVMSVEQVAGNGRDGKFQVDRTEGGGEITAVTITNGGSNYLVGDTLKIIQPKVLDDPEDGYNVCDEGQDGVLTVATVGAEATYPDLDAIYIKNLSNDYTVFLSVNNGDSGGIWDVSVLPQGAFFTRLLTQSSKYIVAKCSSAGQQASIEYLLFEGHG
tara:strand:+ start:149 stop:1345 length:1197 start_codon:yes stop_codon:yes gene_type:complete